MQRRRRTRRWSLPPRCSRRVEQGRGLLLRCLPGPHQMRSILAAMALEPKCQPSTCTHGYLHCTQCCIPEVLALVLISSFVGATTPENRTAEPGRSSATLAGRRLPGARVALVLFGVLLLVSCLPGFPVACSPSLSLVTLLDSVLDSNAGRRATVSVGRHSGFAFSKTMVSVDRYVVTRICEASTTGPAKV